MVIDTGSEITNVRITDTRIHAEAHAGEDAATNKEPSSFIDNYKCYKSFAFTKSTGTGIQ